MSTVREFMEYHYLHYNSREVINAARAYEKHIAQGGKMLVSLAGAMSTARIGRILGRAIRAGMVHAISCTGANLEEDVFNLVAANDYKIIDDWRGLRAEDEKALYEQGYNRVTDTCIPETVMRHIEERLITVWRKACDNGDRKMESEFLFEVLDDPSFEKHFQIPKENSWMYAAKEAGIPVYSPGWEDSTTGNMFAVAVRKKKVPHHTCVKTGTEQLDHLISWYLEATGYDAFKKANPGKEYKSETPSVGFFQVAGGIAGDFAICAVPAIIQDMKLEDAPYWGYFAQISDSVTSYGGYSGAVPNEKITWGKLDVDTPKFMIQSDATIVAPLIFAYLLGD